MSTADYHAMIAKFDAERARIEADAETRISGNENGTVYGPPVRDRDGATFQQVYEYENGECTDRYITKVAS